MRASVPAVTTNLLIAIYGLPTVPSEPSPKDAQR